LWAARWRREIVVGGTGFAYDVVLSAVLLAGAGALHRAVLLAVHIIGVRQFADAARRYEGPSLGGIFRLWSRLA
jgi:hypothetical protein